MKILTIRGENLASLESFEVDLESGPLERVGIFAITGPTGAGKTTLLDALCVALFDRTPRLSNMAGVPVGTAEQDDGLRVRANDVRGLLRRGAGQGFAEVDFVGRDGRTYRARWAVHRSRKRAAGKLQNSEISLTDLETEQVFTGKKRETLEAIEEKLGLSFEQFRRSALLAQNDFAAFLRADREQRSDLLERMTGTDIYTKVSVAAYRRAVDETKSLSALEESADSSAILEDQERAALTKRRDLLRKEHKKQQVALQKAHLAVKWFGESRQAELAVASAESLVSTAQTNLAEMAVTVQRIAAVRQAREKRGTVDAATSAGEQATVAASRHAKAVEALQEAEIRAAAIKEAATQARAAVEAARAQYIESLEIGQTKNAARMESLSAWIEEHRELAAAGGEFAEFATLSAEELDDLRPDLEEQAADSLREAERCFALELNALEARKESKRAADKATSKAELSKVSEIRAEHTLVTQRIAGIQRLQSAVETQTRATTQKTRAEAEGQETALEIERLEAESEILLGEERTCSAALSEAQTAYDRIRLALDLTDHRAALVAGEHCPLCGSEEHPWREDSATSSVVAEQESRVQELRANLEQRRKAVADTASLLRAKEHVHDKAIEEVATKTEEALSAKRLAQAERRGPLFEAFDLSLSVEDLPRTSRLVEERLARAQKLLVVAEALDAEAREAVTAASMAAALWAVASETRQKAELQRQAAVSKLSACQGYRYRTRASELSRCREASAVYEEKLLAAPQWVPELEQRGLQAAQDAEQAAVKLVEKSKTELGASAERALESKQAAEEADQRLHEMLDEIESSKEDLLEKLAVTDEWLTTAESSTEQAKRDVTEASTTLKERRLRIKELLESKPTGTTEEEASNRHDELLVASEAVVEEGVSIGVALKADEEARRRRDDLGERITAASERVRIFRTLSDLIGSADGKKFRVFAQSLTLDSLLAGANLHLEELAPRYILERVPGHDLDLQVVDRDLADEVRSVNSLSGGESFLISLALALGLSSLAAKDVRVESLLVDEGFGSLDGETLEVALSVLDSLQATGRKVGLISHVPGFAERIGAQVIVTPRGGGLSTVRVQGPMSYG